MRCLRGVETLGRSRAFLFLRNFLWRSFFDDAIFDDILFDRIVFYIALFVLKTLSK